MNIRTRLTVQFTVLVSSILLITFLTIYLLRVEYVEEEFFDRLEKKAQTTTELLMKVNEVSSDLLRIIDKSNYDVFINEKLVVYNAKNQEIYTNNDTITYQITPELLNRIRQEKKVRLTLNHQLALGLFFADSYGGVTTIIGAEDLWGRENLDSLSQILVWLYLLEVILFGFAGWYFSGRAMSPITRIINQVKQLFPNQLDQPLTVENPQDEIGQLTLTFNDLLGRLSEAFRLQNLFISNVSHELKNPLMRMGTQLDVAMLKERSTVDYQSLIISVRQDIRELSHLAETLLDLAKVNDESQRIFYGEVRIDEVLWDARSLLLSAEPNYLITVQFDEDISSENQLLVNGNPHLLKTAFVNLMENGCKFSDNSHVNVHVFFTKEGIQLEFQNTGETIASEEMKLIFRPFYRRDGASHIKGYGVGLSLVERIIKLHESWLHVSSDQATRTTIFTIVLPYSKTNDNLVSS